MSLYEVVPVLAGVLKDLSLTDLLMKDKELILLKEEEVVEKLPVVHNLVCQDANAGVLFITNVRVVWNSTATRDLNVSIPYLQVMFAS